MFVRMRICVCARACMHVCVCGRTNIDDKKGVSISKACKPFTASTLSIVPLAYKYFFSFFFFVSSRFFHHCVTSVCAETRSLKDRRRQFTCMHMMSISIYQKIHPSSFLFSSFFLVFVFFSFSFHRFVLFFLPAIKWKSGVVRKTMRAHCLRLPPTASDISFCIRCSCSHI